MGFLDIFKGEEKFTVHDPQLPLKIEQFLRKEIPNIKDSDLKKYLDIVKGDMEDASGKYSTVIAMFDNPSPARKKSRGYLYDRSNSDVYSDMSEDDIIDDFKYYTSNSMDETSKPSTKMKKSELKEMIKTAFLSEADFTNAQDDDAALGGMYDPVYEAEDEEESLDDILARITGTKVDPYLAEAEEEETDMEVDAEEETDMEVDAEEKTANDSIVVDKRIVSLSSLPGETRKILDTLETLRAQAEEFGDQKFITQVGNTITFFTRDFVVAGDEPTKAKVDESLEMLRMKKLAGLLTEGEYAKALLREVGMEASFLPVDPIPGTAELTPDIFDSIKDKLMASGKKLLNKIPKNELEIMKSAAEDIIGPDFGLEDITMNNAKKVGKLLTSRLTEENLGDKIGGILGMLGFGALTGAYIFGSTIAIAGLIAMVVGYIIGNTFGDPNDISIDRGI